MSEEKQPNVFKDDEEKVEDESTTTSETNETSTGLDQNIAGLLCYLVGFVTGLIFYLLEKENKFVRFHAMQSIILSLVLFILSIVLGFIPVIGWIGTLLLGPISLVLWIVMMFKAYKGEWFKLPVIGDMAEQQVNK